jgi:MoxR-like ATPase
MSDALKRRCLHLWIDYPDEAAELRILQAKVPGMDEKLAADLVAMMQRLRQLDLKKTPSIAETIDWARALLALNADSLGEDAVRDTMSVILKYEADIRKAQQELSRMMTTRAAAAAPSAAPAPAAGAAPGPSSTPVAPPKKGTLH